MAEAAAFDRRTIAHAIEATRSAGVAVGRVELHYNPMKIVIHVGQSRKVNQGWFVTWKHRNTDRETAYYYHSRTKRRLRGEPGSPEFIADFAAADAFADEINTQDDGKK